MSDELQELASLEADREQRAHLFPSEQSLLWFVRKHRDELVIEGALRVIAGRQKISPAAADRVVLEVGKRSAQRKVAA